MSVQPQKNTNKLFERLDALRLNKSTITSFSLGAIKRDAQKIKSINATEAFTILGCASFLEHKTDNVISNFNKAVRAGPADFNANANYAVTLISMGRYLDAMIYTRKALAIIGDKDATMMEQACHHAYSAGMIREAARYSSLLSELGRESMFSPYIDACITIMDKNGFSDENVQAYFCVLTDILVKHDIYPEGEQNWVLDNEDGLQLVRDVYVDISDDEAADMNIELSEQMVRLNLPTALLMAFCCSFSAGTTDDIHSIDNNNAS